jgi:hypothetical protein
MSSYLERDTYSQAGDWLFGAVRRNPEAILLLAASCCLLMRSGSASSRSRISHHEDDWGYQSHASRASSDLHRASASAGEGLSHAADSATNAAERAGNYASRMKDRVADTASSYADSVAEFAGDARRNVAEHSARLTRQAQSTLQSTMQRVLREQPLAVAAAGLAVGAAIATIFPSTDIEDRALRGAHEKLKDAAEKAGTRVMDAAGKAGERLKSAAEERGLTSEGLKEMAGEVTSTFADAVAPGRRAHQLGPGQAKASEARTSEVKTSERIKANATPLGVPARGQTPAGGAADESSRSQRARTRGRADAGTVRR